MNTEGGLRVIPQASTNSFLNATVQELDDKCFAFINVLFQILPT